jgi:hypothetical protein
MDLHQLWINWWWRNITVLLLLDVDLSALKTTYRLLARGLDVDDTTKAMTRLSCRQYTVPPTRFQKWVTWVYFKCLNQDILYNIPYWNHHPKINNLEAFSAISRPNRQESQKFPDQQHIFHKKNQNLTITSITQKEIFSL